MRSASFPVLWISCLSALLPLEAAPAQDLTDVLCDPQDPARGCPGERCLCVPDTLAVTFDGDAGSIFDYEEFVEGMPISVTTVMDVKTQDIQAWSYGVRHDPGALTLLEATIGETDAVPALDGGFNFTRFQKVETCGNDAECRWDNRTLGGGWVSAVVLSFRDLVVLPPGRRPVARAAYSLSRDVGVRGTRIELSDRLAWVNSPRTQFNVTIDGRSRLWETLTHGLVKKRQEEKVRPLCDPADPQRTCDYTGCLCLPDTLEITFDGDDDSVLEYSEFKEGMEFEATVVTRTETALIQAWQYGVAHDPAALEILDVTVAGTAAAPALDGGFVVARARNVQTCGADPDCREESRTEGGGWVSAVVLNLRLPVTLPVQRNQLARARYRVLQDVGPEGTLIRFTDRLGIRAAPRTPVNFTVDGRPRQWMTVVDSWVKRLDCPGDRAFRRGDVGMSGPGEEYRADGILNIIDPVRLLRAMFKDEGFAFHCDKAADANDDGALDIADPIHLLRFLFLGGPAPVAPFGGPGIDETPDGLGCCEYP